MKKHSQTNDEIKGKIEFLRTELSFEYEKSLDEGRMSPKVLELSERLDQLILEYMKIDHFKEEIAV